MKFKVLIVGFLIIGSLIGQTIQFSIYVESELTATNEQDFTFGNLNPGVGVQTISLGDGGMGIISISGNSAMDVIVTMDSPTQLTHTGASSDVIPFTLEFAYANHNANDWSTAIPVSSGNSARFKIRGRDSGPAGPPPDPSIRKNSTTPITADATAYIYIYGQSTIGTIDSGSYTGIVTLTVNYD